LVAWDIDADRYEIVWNESVNRRRHRGGDGFGGPDRDHVGLGDVDLDRHLPERRSGAGDDPHGQRAAGAGRSPRRRDAVKFELVRFHYVKGAGVFDDLSFTIQPGEKVGLVGRSGAGKSTLVNLLLRFHDVEGGRILIDGQEDVAKASQDSLRRRIGMVTQDTALLHRSIAENILYGRPEASREEMILAARQAHVEEFVSDLVDPDGRTGYDTMVGERGVKLSGGQHQRIAIARVLLKNAPILVLDEATSALDSEIEAAIQESFQTLMRGKTVIAIAHGLSTITAMDRLIVLETGRSSRWAGTASCSHATAFTRRYGDGSRAGSWWRRSRHGPRPDRPPQTSLRPTKPSMTPSSISAASASPIRWPCHESLLIISCGAGYSLDPMAKAPQCGLGAARRGQRLLDSFPRPRDARRHKRVQGNCRPNGHGRRW
jgi:ABC-type multidrug transport system ATPase subunit